MTKKISKIELSTSESVEATKAENFDFEGENSRGGAEVRPEAETDPEAVAMARGLVELGETA